MAKAGGGEKGKGKGLGKGFMIKFDRTDKAKIRGRVKHTRTGACSCKLGRTCYHGKNYGPPK